MKKVFLLFLLLQIALNNGYASATNTNRLENFFTKDNFVFSSPPHFRVYAPSNFLIIEYYRPGSQEFGIYNPKAGLLAHITIAAASSGNLSTIFFYRIKNEEFMHILNDIVQYPANYRTGEKLAFAKEIFSGNLPSITEDGKYNEIAIWERVEGEKAFRTLRENGIPIVGRKMIPINRAYNDPIGAYLIEEPIEQVISKFVAMPNVLGFNVVKKLSIEVRPKIVDKSKFYKNQELIKSKVSYDGNTGKYNENITHDDSTLIINIEPAKYRS